MIAAIVILFHPNKNTLNKLLLSIERQVDEIIVVDNTEVQAYAASDFQKFSHLTYHPLNTNVGIAKAQNIGIALAIQKNCSHVLLLDQDSCLEPQVVSTLLNKEKELLERGFSVAAIGPIYLEIKTGKYTRAVRQKYLEYASIPLSPNTNELVEADFIIASGSVIRTSVIEHVGLMKECLFIDGVDIEWCYRAKSMGYSTFITSATAMTHSIGDAYIELFGKPIMIHSDLRNRYIIRNSCYFFRLNHVTTWWKITSMIKIPCYVVIYTLHSSRKTAHFFSLIISAMNGFLGRLGKINTRS